MSAPLHLAYIWIVCHLSAKSYQNRWKFDAVLTKTNLLGFFWDTVYMIILEGGALGCEVAVQCDDRDSEDLAQSISPCRRRQQRSSRQQSDGTSADPDARRCRSLSSDRKRQDHSAARAADDMDMIDGIQPLAQAEAGPSDDNGVAGGSFGYSLSLSLSVDSVMIGSASGNKRKAGATLTGKDKKSHRASL